MANSIRLLRGTFGHVSVLTVATNLVTHAHAEPHIIVWLDGTAGEMTIGSERVRLGPRTAAGINSLQPHSHDLSRSAGPGRFLAFYIDPIWVRGRHGLAPHMPIFPSPKIRLEPWLYLAAAGLLDVCEGYEDDALVAYEIERLIDCLIEAADATTPRERAIRRTGAVPDHRVRKAVQIMKDKVAERICFDELARSVGLSRPHFFALFKEQTNLTPNVYWNTLRMEEALRQLQWSEEPLTSVAGNLGFTTQGNFSRFFRDHAGVPPTLYREAARAVA
jgi:AraC-like DNA-binding protein